MLSLYAMWGLFPALFSRARAFKLSIGSIFAALLIGSVCVFQSGAITKDREVYKALIQSIAEDGVLAMEPGFYAIVKVLSWQLSDTTLYSTFFFIVAALSIAIKLQLFKRHGGSVFGCLSAFFSYYFLVHEITQVRIGLAIGVLYISWFAYAERRYSKYLVCGALATLFHYSCLVFLLAPILFSRYRYCRNGVLAMLSLLALLSATNGAIMLTLLERLATAAGVARATVYFDLLEQGILAESSPARLLPHTVLLAIVGLTRKRWESSATMGFVSLIYLQGMLLFIILLPIPALAYRVSDIFLFAGIFVVGQLRRCFSSSTYFLLVIFYTGIFLIYTIGYSGLFFYDKPTID